MSTTSWTQADIEALEAAMKAGVLEVEYADRRVKYHSLDEMLRLRSAMQSAVAAGDSESPKRFSFASFSKE